ncbi:hypothetical protein AWC07_08125 [Mycobacterium gastri]|uniref:Type I restriction modification DNA specificity domain-containing protein n=1 Tax=Mycobacterium gastri TaxID=1777 RepID=A0A1X1VHY5_MYCGS|nr:hypothetical protein AWC07_08125 [Mycobacterium gastri]
MVQFGDVLELQRGHDLPTSSRCSGTVPVIGSFGVTGSHNQAAYDGPGVAIGRSGAAIGTATFVDAPFWPLNTCLFVRDFKGNDPRWVYRLLQVTDFLAFNSGSAQPSLNRNFLRNIEVPLPPIYEQRAIAELLGAFDDKIAANERVVDAAEALMLAAAESVTVRTPLSTLASQSNASRRPEEFADSIAHFSLPAFDANAQPEIVGGASVKSSKFFLSKPCVLFSKLNPRIPRIWDVCTLPAEMALASTEFVVLIPACVDATLLWATLRQTDISEELTQMVAGTSGSHQRIRPHDLLGAWVRDIRELEPDLASLLVDLGQVCHRRRKESQLLARTRDQLLPVLMSGKIRVKDAAASVGEVL